MTMALSSPASSLAEAFSAEEVEAFQQQGYAIVRGLARSELVARMIDVTRDGLARRIEPIELEADLRYPGAPESRGSEGGSAIRRLKQAFSRDPVFLEWMQEPAVVQRIKQLLGPEIVCPLAHHNCIMTKEARFSSDTGWHQDVRYWSFARPDLVSLWLALGPEREANGCLQLIPGSHNTPFPRSSFDDALFFRTDLEENQPSLRQRILAELEPGDALFFHGRTLHAATRNRTDQTKFSVVFTFRSADNPPLPGSRSAQPELILH